MLFVLLAALLVLPLPLERWSRPPKASAPEDDSVILALRSIPDAADTELAGYQGDCRSTCSNQLQCGMRVDEFAFVVRERERESMCTCMFA